MQSSQREHPLPYWNGRRKSDSSRTYCTRVSWRQTCGTGTTIRREAAVMDLKEFAPRHATYIDYLKERERDIAIQLGAAIADRNMADNKEDKLTFDRRIDVLYLMKDIVSDAIDKEKI
jgi:hypothetical protein